MSSWLVSTFSISREGVPWKHVGLSWNWELYKNAWKKNNMVETTTYGKRMFANVSIRMSDQVDHWTNSFHLAGRTSIIEDSSRILGDAQECHAGAFPVCKKVWLEQTHKERAWKHDQVLSVCVDIYIDIYWAKLMCMLIIYINVRCIHLHPQLPGFVVAHPLLGFLGIRHLKRSKWIHRRDSR